MADDTMTTSDALANLEIIIKRNRAFDHLAGILRASVAAEADLPMLERRRAEAEQATLRAEDAASAASKDLAGVRGELDGARKTHGEAMRSLQDKLTAEQTRVVSEIEKLETSLTEAIQATTVAIKAEEDKRAEEVARLPAALEQARADHNTEMARLAAQEQDLKAKIAELQQSLDALAARVLGR